MKKFKQVIATVAVAAMIMSAVACSKKEDATTESNPSESTAASEVNADGEGPKVTTNEEFIKSYGSQLPYYMNHQYYINGEPISIVESNYYFIQAFNDLSSYASYYNFPITQEGKIDLAAEYDSTGTSDADLGTWGDFLVEYAENQIKQEVIMRKLAEEKGITISDEDMATIDGFFSDLQTNKVEASGLTMDEYLQQYFGDYCTQEELSEAMIHMNLVERYMADYESNYVYNEADVSVPNLRYALFYAPEGTSQEQMDSQKTAAEEFLAKCTDLDVFEVEGALAQTSGAVKEFGSSIAVEKGVMVPEFEAWAWDSSRKEGDIELIKTEAYGYFVVGYLGTTVSENAKASAAMTALNEEMGKIADSYEFYTNDEFTGVPVVITPTPEYSNVTVIREDGTVQNPKNFTDYTNVIIIAVLGVSAAGIIGASIYGNVAKKKEMENKQAEKKSAKKSGGKKK